MQVYSAIRLALEHPSFVPPFFLTLVVGTAFMLVAYMVAARKNGKFRQVNELAQEDAKLDKKLWLAQHRALISAIAYAAPQAGGSLIK